MLVGDAEAALYRSFRSSQVVSVFGIDMTLCSYSKQARRCTNIAAAEGRLIGSLAYILAVLGRGTSPRGEEMAGRSPGVDSQDLATILDPFRGIFADLGPELLSAI